MDYYTSSMGVTGSGGQEELEAFIRLNLREVHKTNKEHLNQQSQESIGTAEQLVDKFIVPDKEERIPIKPLPVKKYRVWPAGSPMTDENSPMVEGFNAEMHLSNNRLFLVETGISDNTREHRYGDSVDVTATDKIASNVVAFPLNNIYGISLKIQTEVEADFEATMTSKAILWPVFVGVFLLFVAIVAGLATEMMALLIGLGIAGLIFLIIGLVYRKRSPEITRPPNRTDSQEWKLILVTLDPYYMNRASLVIFVEETKTTPQEIMQWAKEMQNRCLEIAKPAVFEKSMIV
ncbi:phage holin family protein [Chloroflexota bacterium]